MELSDQDIALFEAYFDHRLKKKERRQFQQRLAANTDFKQDWEQYLSTRFALQNLGRLSLKEQLAAKHAELSDISIDYKPAKRRAWQRFFKRFFIALVIGAMSYGLFYMLSGSSYESAPVIKGAPSDYSLPLVSGDAPAPVPEASQVILSDSVIYRIDTIRTYKQIQVEVEETDLEELEGSEIRSIRLDEAAKTDDFELN